MQNVMSIWQGLGLRHRLIVAGATLAVFVAILALARMTGTGRMDLLYAGLDGNAAGEVIAALDQRAVAYEVRGDAIWVDAAERDGLRMALAGDGLPSIGGAGYEILDSLSGFGTTSQMFDAAYWRAKEGELARTVLALPGVRAARVHLSRGPSDPFRRNERPTASITVTTASGRLGTENAEALRHLVASAVAGMRADDVQVIDTAGGLIRSASDDTTTSNATADARATEIQRGIERLLAARVGVGRAVVEVAVELDTDSEQITERRFNPDERIAISSETEEKTQQRGLPEGDVTVASNLPDGDADGKAAESAQSSETRERINYEVSETNRQLVRAPGAVRRMTVAVLVDDEIAVADDGSVTRVPRSDEELATLRELVASAAGLDEERGDVLTLRSMEFQPMPAEGTEAVASLLPDFGRIDLMTLIQIIVLAIVAVVLGLFVVRPIIASSRQVALPPGAAPQMALPGMADPSSSSHEDGALTGTIDDGDMPDLPSVATAATTGPAEDPVERLRRLIGERQSETIEILRGWLEPDEERA